MNLSPLSRSWIGLISLTLVGCFTLGLSWYGIGAAPVIAAPQVSFAELPAEIGGWHGTELALTDQEYEVLDALDVASVQFTDDAGRIAYVHTAVWDNPDYVAEVCPHHPTVCYRNTGWTAVDEKLIELDVPEVGLVPVQLLLLSREKVRVVVAFTYEIGEFHFTTDRGARAVQMQLLSRHTWPPVTKFLVQTAAPSIDEGFETVRPLLAGLIGWNATASRPASI
ncbi:EpsI family protein [Stieleria sp. TO1_6]|uniref:exosortase C-terminal domain/associated protein EpsI n=1 Tax=Stieleria tagensis TaxID=2956795 RepID=UPI00209B0797|nr:exosortase C-terminal domain/associated protein EpsI [Stieleria tagensis]MCO8120612.1 EpsI family protein [Stieleria tagensis]